MSDSTEDSHLARLLRELRKLPAETAWVEFKHNNCDPELIGELVSALSNASALEGKEKGYVVWGIEDGSHNVVGTTFIPSKEKKGNQDLESWLVQNMSPRLNLRFHLIESEGQRIVILEIPAARDRPTRFKDRELIRVSSTRRTLKDYPELERALWRHFDKTPFERQMAFEDCSGQDVLRLLDHFALFDLVKRPIPPEENGILEALSDEDFIRANRAGRWNITNLGAILLSRDLTQFPTLARKAVRLIIYGGQGRTKTEREQEGRKGYAVGFEGLMSFLKDRLPRNEVIGEAFRREVPMYPDLALRELIANAIIHQDFAVTGAGPMVEVFDNRIEISNPGTPLGDIDRLLDQAPRSRNEALAAFMRRIGLCEERGSGVDKVVSETELYQLPPPRLEVSGDAFRAILFAHKEFRNMDRAERVHACYLHACLRYVMREEMTNSTVRERFGIDVKNSAQASRIIRDALDEGVIKPYDTSQGKRNARYVPAWV